MRDFFLIVVGFAPFLALGILSGSLFRSRPPVTLSVMEVVLCVYLMWVASSDLVLTFPMTAYAIAQVFATIIAGQWLGWFLMRLTRPRKTR
jgi:hypothetical protein